MTLNRWSKQVAVIDYTAKSVAESDFVDCWLKLNGRYRESERSETVTGGMKYTVSLHNYQVARFMHDLEEYHAEDVHLQEMEVYFNEH